VDVVGEVAELDPQVGVALVELQILAEAGLDCLCVNKNKNLVFFGENGKPTLVQRKYGR
jgi:hypothetical protein